MVAAMAVFIGAIGSMKYFQIKAAIAQGTHYQPPPEAVTTIVASAEPWSSGLSAIGTVVAVNGVNVAADLPGLVDEIDFESGRRVNKGDVLLRLDTKEERAQLASAIAQRDLAKLDIDRQRGLLAQGIVPQATFDQSAAVFKQADARVAEIQATIDRKTIRAPFSGVLGIRQVNRGQYLAGGAPIVSLQALQPAYVQFNVPQHDIEKLQTGRAVEAMSDVFTGVEKGTVQALDAVIDEATRNVRVQAIFANRDENLRPGMFVRTQLTEGAVSNVVTLPASAINYAPFGDSVYIVGDSKGPDGKSFKSVRQQFVKIGESRGDQVAVVSGVKPGDEVVTSGVFKLRPGAAVIVNNSVQPANNPNPKPQDS